MANGESRWRSLAENGPFIVFLLTSLVVCSVAYASLRTQSDENERRIRALEERPTVTLQQYQDGQRQLEQRLDRIERKIDNAEPRKH